MHIKTAPMARTTSRNELSGAGSRSRDLQGLRAIAILSVVLYHADVGPPGGFIGVDVFFVLSGFLISRLLFRELRSTGRINYHAFIARRARRLIPAQATLAIFVIAGSGLLLSPFDPVQNMAAKASLFATAFLANLFFAVSTGYFLPEAEENPFLHMWSLSVEEQYYVAFPVVLFAVWSIFRKRLRPYRMPLLGIAIACSLAFCVAASFGVIPSIWPVSAIADPDTSARIAFFSPMTRAWEFLLGTAVAILASRLSPSRLATNVLAYLGVLALTLSFVIIDDTDQFPGVAALLPVCATCCLLLASGARHSTGPGKILSSAPLVAIGNISYSWYLWHWPIIVIAEAWFEDSKLAGPVAAIASLAPAIMSYRWIEQPILKKRVFPSPRSFRNLTVGFMATSTVLACALLAASSANWFRPDLSRTAAVLSPHHLDQAAGCADGKPLGPLLPSACTWGTGGTQGTILLIGDSNASHFTESLISAAQAFNMNLQVATASGCPFLTSRLVPSDGCGDFVSKSLSAIEHRPVPYSAIVISNFSAGYISRGLGHGPGAPEITPRPKRDRAHDVKLWAEALEQTLTRLRDRSPIFIVGAIPQHRDFPNCMARSVFAAASKGCGVLAPQEVEDGRGDVVSAERSVARKKGAIPRCRHRALLAPCRVQRPRQWRPGLSRRRTSKRPGSSPLRSILHPRITRGTGLRRLMTNISPIRHTPFCSRPGHSSDPT